jgi:hypothetical protein
MPASQPTASGAANERASSVFGSGAADAAGTVEASAAIYVEDARGAASGAVARAQIGRARHGRAGTRPVAAARAREVHGTGASRARRRRAGRADRVQLARARAVAASVGATARGALVRADAARIDRARGHNRARPQAAGDGARLARAAGRRAAAHAVDAGAREAIVGRRAGLTVTEPRRTQAARATEARDTLGV